ncbi:MAG: M1 family peptidase, partial [Desulfobacterales bacterium]|nr:M1 family peptidase [Desulfobacterales bacterium]
MIRSTLRARASRVALLGVLVACRLPAAAMEVHHELAVQLIPSERRLVGSDELTVRASGAGPFALRLPARVRVNEMLLDGRPVTFVREGDRLRMEDTGRPDGGTRRIRIDYEGIFDDPVPSRPANADNPGYGVTGTISPRGTFLLAGAGWYPQVSEGRSTFRVRITAPEGVLAVTAGRSLGHTTVQGATVSVWEVSEPTEGLSLSAGRYHVKERRLGDLQVATYLLAENLDLADPYLEGSAGFLDAYAQRFGAYPFAKFAVVENFFPTGYGFPSYTLLGSAVLRLPFIVHTSLGHEVAHCWWGNGVQVNPGGGNWSEGLTTYVSDYLFREQDSAAAGREYRLEILRKFTTVNRQGQGPSLSRFQGRYDPLTQSVGYGKGAMVFHMLRKLVGEESFWGALRDLYRQRLFQPTSWTDVQQAFEARARRSLDRFFHQWVHQPGAPRLSLADVTRTRLKKGWKVTGALTQDGPIYDLRVNLAVATQRGDIQATVNLVDARTPFEVVCNAPPLRLTVDPEIDLFRQLLPGETPPSVDTLKAAGQVLVVLSDAHPRPERGVLETLLRTLGIAAVDWVRESRLEPGMIGANDLLLAGLPVRRELLRTLPPQVALDP